MTNRLLINKISLFDSDDVSDSELSWKLVMRHWRHWSWFRFTTEIVRTTSQHQTLVLVHMRHQTTSPHPFTDHLQSVDMILFDHIILTWPSQNCQSGGGTSGLRMNWPLGEESLVTQATMLPTGSSSWSGEYLMPSLSSVCDGDVWNCFSKRQLFGTELGKIYYEPNCSTFFFKSSTSLKISVLSLFPSLMSLKMRNNVSDTTTTNECWRQMYKMMKYIKTKHITSNILSFTLETPFCYTSDYT